MILLQYQSIFQPASKEAEKLNVLNWYFIIAASGMLLLVISLVAYIVFKYKHKKGNAEPPQTAGNRKLEFLMIGFPLLLVTLFFFLSVSTMSTVLPPIGNSKPNVVIIAHQWWWEVKYPGTQVITANEVHFPTGQKILLQLNAADVIHDWWIPAFGAKMDMIPGKNNYLWVTINKPGIYQGTCSEFCGQQHAWMRIRVVAQSPEDYDIWLQENARNAIHPRDTVAQLGEALFMNSSCSSCHQIRGTLANGLQAPDLTHFAGRSTMLAGMRINNNINVNTWLTDPQKVKPGAHMPRFIFGEDSVKAISAYLSQLK